MLTITDVLAVPATGGYFADDQAAIKAGAVARRARLSARRAGAGGGRVAAAGAQRRPRRPRGLRERAVQRRRRARAAVARRRARARGCERELARGCAARRSRPFREPTRCVDGLRPPATASRRRCSTPPRTAPARTMAEVVRAEWGLDATRSGRPRLRPDRRGAPRQRRQDDPQAGRLAAARADQHAARSRRELVPYVRWVRDRVLHLRSSEAYAPILHFDVYGLLGDDGRERADRSSWPRSRPRRSRCASSTRSTRARATAQIARHGRAARAPRRAARAIVADEWANTVEDIRAFNAARAADVMQIKAPDLGLGRRTSSTPCSTARRTASSPTSAARAPRPSARRRSPCTSRSAPTPTSCWPSPAWASTRASRSCATRWRGRLRSRRITPPE